MRRTFLIPVSRFAELKRRISALAKRANRLGSAEVGYSETGRTETRQVTHSPEGVPLVQPYAIELVEVEVYGEEPRLVGWRFAATLQHLDEDTILAKSPWFDEELDPRFRNAAPDCEHCNLNRARRDTYVVIGEDGEQRQVGRTCLKDYMGHGDPEAVAAAVLAGAQLIGLLESEEDPDGWSASYGERSYDLARVLTKAAIAIRNEGWLSRSKAREEYREGLATADTVEGLMFNNQDPRRTKPEWLATADDAKLAAAAAEWAAEIDTSAETSDYMHNVSVIGQAGRCTARQIGLAVSIVGVYQAELARRAEAELVADSEHVGEAGKRQNFELTLLSRRYLESQHGVTVLHRFVDPGGNLLVWFGSRDIGMPVGGTRTVRATVKRHDSYQGTAQTIITRANLAAK